MKASTYEIRKLSGEYDRMKPRLVKTYHIGARKDGYDVPNLGTTTQRDIARIAVLLGRKIRVTWSLRYYSERQRLLWGISG